MPCKIVIRQTKRIYRECKTAQKIRHALMQLDAEEHYQLLIRVLKVDKELDDVGHVLYDRRQEVDRVFKDSLEFLLLSKEISKNKNSDSANTSPK